jgi:hypothetical protein
VTKVIVVVVVCLFVCLFVVVSAAAAAAAAAAVVVVVSVVFFFFFNARVLLKYRYKKDCIKKTFKVIPGKSIYHVENPEESEYFEMRPNINNADSEESDEDPVYFAGERDRDRPLQASTPSTVSSPTPITALKASKDSAANSHSYSPIITATVPLVSSGAIQPTIIPANATPVPKVERIEKKKSGKVGSEVQRDSEKFERDRERREGGGEGVEREEKEETRERDHPTPRDSSGKDAMAISLQEIAKMKKERSSSNALNIDAFRDTQDEAMSPKLLAAQGATKSSKQIRNSNDEERV